MTFGVELEFVLWYMYAETWELVALRHANPGIVIVPVGQPRSPAYIRAVVIDRLRREGNVDINPEPHLPPGFPEPPAPSAPDDQHPNAGNTRQAKYLRWTLTTDHSVKSLNEPLVRGDYRPLCGIGLELVSPALRHTLASYQEIRRVMEFFRANFAFTVNETAGLHVHVGVGRDYLPLPELRRAAILAWLTEDLLLELHPNRDKNEHTPPVRRFSNLALGLGAEAAGRAGYYFGLKPTDPRGPREPRGLAEGLQELMNCTSVWAVVKLMDVAETRGMVSLFNYGLTHPHCGHLNDRAKRTTIEFRAAAGTMNPEWVLIWSSICVGLIEAAGDIDDAHLVELEEFLTTASVSGRYGVPQLLDKIGLFKFQAQWLRNNPDPIMRTTGTIGAYEILTQAAWLALHPGSTDSTEGSE